MVDRGPMYTDPTMTAFWIVALAGLPFDAFTLRLVAGWFDEVRIVN